MLSSSITSSGGVGVGFGFNTGGGGGSPRDGAIRSAGVVRGTGVGVGVGFAGRAGVCTLVGVGVGVALCCGVVSVLFRRGRDSWVRAAEAKVEPMRPATVSANAITIENR